MKSARNLFAYSILYLFALFAALLVERRWLTFRFDLMTSPNPFHESEAAAKARRMRSIAIASRWRPS